MCPQTIKSDDLVNLGNSANGLRLNSRNFTVDELLIIANAAKNGNATVVFTGVANLNSDDLSRIGSIGSGYVLLEH